MSKTQAFGTECVERITESSVDDKSTRPAIVCEI